jgi:hypothetical protein
MDMKTSMRTLQHESEAPIHYQLFHILENASIIVLVQYELNLHFHIYFCCNSTP